MRNSKVRQRIAAGKLKLRIRDLRNLGMKSEQILADIGIYTADELRRQGAVRTFAELKRAGMSPSLNMLWALAGALDPWPEGTHWREIARGEARLSLLLAVEDLENAALAAHHAAAALKPAP
jgi:transcriptional regulator with XRE-family HTH domain